MSAIDTYNTLKGTVRSFEDLEGRILSKVEVGDDEIRFYLTQDHYAKMYHSQDCCESVYIEDICGDLDDLVGEVLLMAEEVSYDAGPLGGYEESYTWTFYRFRTRKGSVDIRWYGSSNGYYSESVSVDMIGGESDDQDW